MYANLKAEMARKNITGKDLAKAMGRSVSTISLKLNGKTRRVGFTFDEASRIKEILGVDMSLDELFAQDEEEAQ